MINKFVFYLLNEHKIIIYYNVEETHKIIKYEVER
ncbi:protein of unknown function [Xenorhabdus doucetiae]|uniref:Uncharacterized protein n=1 Tax=Xenorhabdus doucetiae TaxID=351671 RepID=A0A068QRI7_9GAMM|nr:protein of unknown function [Xenorhabdus doucetiae]